MRSIIKLQNYQKSLRLHETEAERMLWYRLRNRRLLGVKFRRQEILHGYIVDFLTKEHRLVIELDGSQHQIQKEYDDRRSAKLLGHGYIVLRFWNNEVISHMDDVLETIISHLPLVR